MRPRPSSQCSCCSGKCSNCVPANTPPAIRALLNLAPKTARKITDEGESEVALESIVIGDHVRVRPGETISVDGVSPGRRSAVLSRWSPANPCRFATDIAAARLSRGRSIAPVRSGARDTDRQVSMLARKSFAAGCRSPAQPSADSAARGSRFLVVCARCDRSRVISSTAWMAFCPSRKFTFALVSAVTVLIFACACSLGSGDAVVDHGRVGRGAQAGVLSRTPKRWKPWSASTRSLSTRPGRSRNESRRSTAVIRRMVSPRMICCGRRGRGAAPARIRLSVAIVGAAEERRLIDPCGRRVSILPSGKGAFGTVGGHNVVLGVSRSWCRTRYRYCGSRPRRPLHFGGRAPRPFSSASTAGLPARSPSLIRSKNQHPPP